MQSLTIYGAVIVRDREYEDNEIAQLVGKEIPSTWNVAGDLDKTDVEASIVVICGQELRVFESPDPDFLQNALAYIAGLNKET